MGRSPAPEQITFCLELEHLAGLGRGVDALENLGDDNRLLGGDDRGFVVDHGVDPQTSLAVCGRLTLRAVVEGGALGEEERIIVAFSVFGGYQSEEIGRMTGYNPATVRSKKKRALEKMRKIIEPEI